MVLKFGDVVTTCFPGRSLNSKLIQGNVLYPPVSQLTVDHVSFVELQGYMRIIPEKVVCSLNVMDDKKKGK